MTTRLLAPGVLSALVSLSSPVSAQADWKGLQPTTQPPPLSDVAMAYDSVRDRTVLYGGWNGTRDLADTWEYDGKTFTKMSPRTQPGPRSTHGMAFDVARRNVVTFGGYCGANCAIGTTWTYDGNDWTQRKPAQSPSPRMAFGMAYDTRRSKVVLFGGFCGATSCVFGETWEWDGANWRKITTRNAPSPRFSTALAYDAARGEMVLFGGRDASRRLSDTWTYDGSDWHKRSPTTVPGPRTAHGLVYDAARERTVLFGGFDGFSHRDQTWEWDGREWRLRTPKSHPSARSFFAFAFDRARGRVLLFGGGNRSGRVGGLFAYATGAPATYERFGVGCAGTGGMPTLDAGERPWIGDRLTLTLTGIAKNSRSAIFAIGASRTRWGGLVLPRSLASLGMPGCTLYVAPESSYVVPAAAGRASWTVAIPDQPALRLVRFYSQAFALDSVNAAGLVVSNAGSGVLGLR